MSIFDALTGDASHQAADQQRQAYGAIIPGLAGASAGAYDRSRGYLQGDANQPGALGYLGQGYSGAMGQLGQARDALTANGGAYAPLSALAGQYGKGANLYADSLGINGSEGNQRAVDAFHTGPGYNFALNQGVDSITRAANAAGGLGGNSLKDTIGFGQGLANQEYGNWQKNLSGYNPLQLQATYGAAAGNAGINSAVAGTYGLGANLSDQYGRNQAGVAGQLAGNEIGANKDYQGLMLGGLNGWNDTYKQDANASNQASANSLKLGMDIAKMAASAASGVPMGSSGSSSFMPSQSFQNNSWGW